LVGIKDMLDNVNKNNDILGSNNIDVDFFIIIINYESQLQFPYIIHSYQTCYE